MRALSWTAILARAGGCALLGACAGRESASPPFVLDSVRPRSAQGVYLNEDLVFSFSAEIDPLSVLGHSVRIHDDAGEPARGEWLVEGTTLRFAPAPVRDADLTDGGYRPGTRYVVEILGFPRLAAIRDLEGRPLAATLRWAFETVAVIGEREGYVFEDASPAHAEPLRVLHERPWIAPYDPVILTCAEPVDPSTLRDEDFALVLDGAQVDLRSVLVRNVDEGDAPPGAPCAVIELYPRRGGPLAPGSYTLRLAHPLHLQDFGGNAVIASPAVREREIRVSEPGAMGERSQQQLPFLDAKWASPLELPGMDGTALWHDDGRVTIRYPAAAGDGSDGVVQLGEREARRDVQATSLVLARGTRCTLEGSGLRVLRAQGKIVLSGELVRRAAEPLDGELERRTARAMVVCVYDAETASIGMRDVLAPAARDAARAARASPLHRPLAPACAALARAYSSAEPSAPTRMLGAWLEDARRRDPSWTVIVAGGDLVIDGSVDVDTPLLLVAGGMIRTYGKGEVRAPDEELRWLGGLVGWNLGNSARAADLLRIDPPAHNPLRVPLRYGVLSHPLPAAASVQRWVDAFADGRPRAGQSSSSSAWSVRFLPASAPLDPAYARDHPTLLEQVGPVKLWIELEVGPPAVWNPASFEEVPPMAWDPPFVDFVHVSWEERER